MTSEGGLKKSTSEGDIKVTPPQLTPNNTSYPSPTSAPSSAPAPTPAPAPAPASTPAPAPALAPNIDKSTFTSENSSNKQAYHQHTSTSSFAKKHPMLLRRKIINTIMIRNLDTRWRNKFSHKISQLKTKSCISTTPRETK